MPSLTKRRPYVRFNNAVKRLIRLTNGSLGGDNSAESRWLFDTCKRIVTPTFSSHGRERYTDSVRCSVRIVIEPVDRAETEVLSFVASAYEDGYIGFVANGFNPADSDHKAFAEATELGISRGEWGIEPSDEQIERLVQYLRALTLQA